MKVVVRVNLDRRAGLELPTIARETTWTWVSSKPAESTSSATQPIRRN